MYLKRLAQSVILSVLLMVTPVAIFAQATYIRITANRVNIRTGPSTSYPIAAKARKGDVFEFHGREGKWVRIRLFSVNWRYVYRPLTEITPYVVSIPKRDSSRRDIFRALVKAEDRAEAKADQKYPLEDRAGRPISKNVKKNLDYMWLLSDGYKLEVMHRFRVAPPIHSIITREGIRKNW
jgi:SH3-like domain-containing protein